MTLSSVFCFISLLFFNFSPNNYSFLFSLSCLFFYLLVNFSYFSFWSKEKGVGFEYFYMISFGMTNFIYPVFYFIDNRYVSLFSYGFNTNVISKATALALVAYCFYIFGLNLHKKNKYETDFKGVEIDSFYPIIFFIFSFFSFLFFILFGGLDHFRSVYSGDAEWSLVGTFSYFYLIFNYSSLLLAMFVYKSKNKIFIMISSIYLLAVILLLLLSGSRMTSVGIVLVLLVSFSKNIKRVPLSIATLLVSVASVLLYGVMLYRSMFSMNATDGGDIYKELSNDFSFFDSFMDLIVNNRNLYVLVDFVDTNGFVFFSNTFYNLISFLPFSKSINDMAGIPEYLNGNLPSFLEFGLNRGFGLGTNNVGEAYLSFGLFGVILFFTFFGYFLKMIKERASFHVVFYILYFVLISVSVIYPRGNVLINTRVLIWPLVIFLMAYVLRKILVRVSR